jgi:hypothetical protein
MDTLTVEGKPHQVASSWEELTEKQLLELVPVVFCRAESHGSRLAALRLLIPSKALSKKQFKRLTTEQLYDLFRMVDWLWQSQPSGAQMREFSHRGVTYLLPEPNFSYVVGIEYAMADTYFNRFTRVKKAGSPGGKDPDLKALNMLVATLCRPQAAGLNRQDPEWNGDPREKYNAAIAETRAAAFRDLPLSIRVIALQCAIGGFRQLTKQYKAIFEKTEGEAGPPGGAASPASGSGNNYVEMLFDLAESQVFGDWEKTCFTPIHTLFAYLKKKKLERHE